MATVRLMERLNRRASERNERRVRDEQRVKDSVAAHIRQLLNTRRGNVPIDREFGMPQLTQRGGEAGGQDEEVVKRAIRDLLAEYESRISDVEVVSRGFSGRQLGLDIEIKGAVAYRDRPLPVRLRGTLLADGRFVF